MGRTGQAKEKLLRIAIDAVWASSYGSTTVEDLCQAAGVQKGSFYHYFSSKADLINAALEHDWHETYAPLYDRCFSATKPPLQRLMDMAQIIYAEQEELMSRSGRVLGCPLMSIAIEVSITEQKLAQTIDMIFQVFHRYLVSVLREAQAEGLIEVDNVEQTAVILHRYIDGAISQSRIKNSLAPLKNLGAECLKLLGAKINVTKSSAKKSSTRSIA